MERLSSFGSASSAGIDAPELCVWLVAIALRILAGALGFAAMGLLEEVFACDAPRGVSTSAGTFAPSAWGVVRRCCGSGADDTTDGASIFITMHLFPCFALVYLVLLYPAQGKLACFSGGRPAKAVETVCEALRRRLCENVWLSSLNPKAQSRDLAGSLHWLVGLNAPQQVGLTSIYANTWDLRPPLSIASMPPCSVSPAGSTTRPAMLLVSTALLTRCVKMVVVVKPNCQK